MTKSNNSGFSLIEITISIAIIALLIAAVTTAGNLREKANYNKMVDDINMVAAATAQFQSIYGGLPGDLYNAKNYFGEIVSNGNGNEMLDTPNNLGEESRAFWHHLSRAGLISGSYDNTTNIPGSGVMSAPFKNGGYYVATTPLGSVTLIVARPPSGLFTTISQLEGILEPSIVEKYDITYDDGVANTGRVRAVAGSDFSGSPQSCQNSGVYNTTGDQKACVLQVIIYGESTYTPPLI